MDDYLTRVAEAVRDACAAEAFMETTLAAEYVSAACPGEIISNMILNNIDLQAVIASVPRPEPVFYVLIDGEETQFNGKNAFSRGRTGGQPLYAEPVAAQPAEPDRRAAACMAAMDHISTETLESFNRIGIKFDATRGYAEELEAEIATLRSAIRDMASMLQAREWAEHVSTDPDVTDLEVQVTELVGTATTLREQNAALVAELKAIDDLTGRAGFEFGGPLAIAIKEGLGDRGEFFELACIAGGYFEAISKHTDNALSSAKGNKA